MKSSSQEYFSKAMQVFPIWPANIHFCRRSSIKGISNFSLLKMYILSNRPVNVCIIVLCTTRWGANLHLLVSLLSANSYRISAIWHWVGLCIVWLQLENRWGLLREILIKSLRGWSIIHFSCFTIWLWAILKMPFWSNIIWEISTSNQKMYLSSFW